MAQLFREVKIVGMSRSERKLPYPGPVLRPVRARHANRLAVAVALVTFVAFGFALATPCVAEAQESHLHSEGSFGHAMGEPQSHEFGWGGQLGLGYELRFAKILGVEAMIDGFVLAQGNPPVNPALAPHGAGTGFDGRLGIRLHPLGRVVPDGLWIEASGGVVATGTLGRPEFQARLGYDVAAVHKHPELGIGPFVGYTQVFQPDDTLVPQDAHLLWAGIQVDFAVRSKPRPTDRDGDGVLDEQDACPDVPGVPTTDPKTNGCPPAERGDRDHDGVFDDEDACPDVPGVRTTDPTTNGCPPDRDKDGVLDAEDACPDVPGVRTTDPKTNGCPLPPDRDKDGVLDSVDACPDVPGVHTEDPKTNGCPAATEMVRVEGDQILLGDVIHFDLGSPRVRHVSWPLVEKLAKYFEHTPDIEEVDIEGYADETGTEEYNLYLSRERASAVKQLLVHFGVDEKKLTTHAYGESRPREPGHDAKARAENRRVEFTITHARSGTTPAQPVAPGMTPTKTPANPDANAPVPVKTAPPPAEPVIPKGSP
jgi:outer membrane protein OmpA-like peptidoglycan-associated protein